MILHWVWVLMVYTHTAQLSAESRNPLKRKSKRAAMSLIYMCWLVSCGATTTPRFEESEDCRRTLHCCGLTVGKGSENYWLVFFCSTRYNMYLRQYGCMWSRCAVYFTQWIILCLSPLMRLAKPALCLFLVLSLNQLFYGFKVFHASLWVQMCLCSEPT